MNLSIYVVSCLIVLGITVFIALWYRTRPARHGVPGSFSAVLTEIEIRVGGPLKGSLICARMVRPDDKDRVVWLSQDAVMRLRVEALKRCDPFKSEDLLRRKVNELLLEKLSGSASTLDQQKQLEVHLDAAFAEAGRELAHAYRQASDKQYRGTAQFIVQGGSIQVVDFFLDD